MRKLTNKVEPQVPEPSASEVKLAIDKLKSHKSPDIDQIPAELIKAGVRTICLEIHKLIYFYLAEGETAWRVEGVDHSTYS